jgi:hypothetical protein
VGHVLRIHIRVGPSYCYGVRSAVWGRPRLLASLECGDDGGGEEAFDPAIGSISLDAGRVARDDASS